MCLARDRQHGKWSALLKHKLSALDERAIMMLTAEKKALTRRALKRSLHEGMEDASASLSTGRSLSVPKLSS